MIKEVYDLVLVGTSFASSFFLKKYLEKAPPTARVLVLERGEMLPHSKRLAHAREQQYGLNTFISSLSNHNPTFDNTQSTKPWIFDPNFGGSSNCWTGCTPRFMPNDFQLYSVYGVGADWPFNYNAIEPYYCEAEEVMQISGPEVTPYPMSKAYPLPPHMLSTTDRLIQQQYGELYISQPTARASKATGKRGACCTTAICHLCPVSAKFTIENTMMQLYQDPRVILQYGSQVFALDTEGNKVKGVLYTQRGVEKTAYGEVVAIGANALFNGHILRNSGDSSPLAGKGLSEQVGLYGYFYLDGLDNIGGSSTITANGFMLYDGAHRRERAACIIENHNDPFIRNEKGRWRQIMKMKFVFEDLPDNKNEVVSSEANKLIPVARYQRHSDYAQRGIDYLRQNVEKLFPFLPVEKVEIDEFIQPTEAHILGTARMSKNPAQGVVDDKLCHHQFRNLFVLGGSAFPALSPANPSLTIAALSLRSADLSF
ncbi:GMC oxidoreductase [Nafulsella turpanensis]|uniref:GMC oxidoreductase n=1 Tax=Nafulsella turpanensis TaxID=1265690 RepID=UPI00034CEEFB|nr:GMC oxidoreductase [Nafulsella turpanensis]